MKEKTLLSVFLPQFPEMLRRRNEQEKAANGSEHNFATGGFTVKEEKGAAEEEALKRLARWAYRFTPLVAVDALPDFMPEAERAAPFFGINLDVTGCERLHEKEKGLLTIAEKIQDGLLRSSFPSRIALAPTLGAAWALSRYGKEILTAVPFPELREKLSPLPISALRLPPEMEISLQEVNIRQMGEIFALPRHALLSRFEKTLIKRVDQILGVEEEPLRPITLSYPLRFEATFYTLTNSLESLEHAAKVLLQKLLREILPQHKLVLRLALSLKPYRAALLSRTISVTIPTGDEEHLFSLLVAQLQALHSGIHPNPATGDTGIESLILCAEKVVDAKPVRSTFLPSQTEPALSSRKDFGELIDTLTENLGADQILSMETSASHIPEHAFRFLSLRERLTRRTKLAAPTVAADRPSVLFPSPYKIKAMSALPDGPPFWLKWHDAIFKIESAHGPERIAPEWWDPSTPQFTRDYFKVQLHSGTWLWIYRELQTSNWYLHGLWT